MSKRSVEFGRSMLEMLAVLVLMALLAVGVLRAFQYISDKRTVAILIDEAMMNRARLELEMDKTDQDWFSIKSKTKYQVAFRYDREGNIFMRVEGVEQRICGMLLQETGLFSFLTEENQAFIECVATNTMILAMNKNVSALVECIEDADCQAGFCIDGQCTACAENQYWDAMSGSCHDKCVAHADCPSDGGEGYCATNGRCRVCTGAQYDADAGGCVCNNGHQNEVFLNGACRCPNNYFRKTDGNCISCTNTNNQAASEEECMSCGSRSYNNGQCSYVRFKGGSNGNSNYTCDRAYKVIATASECAKCDATSSPREYWTENGTGYCFLKCKDNEYRIDDGRCFDCTTHAIPYAYDPAECAKCGSQKDADGYCVPVCLEGQFLVDDNEHYSYSWCADCSEIYEYYTTAENCAACAHTDSPRQMRGGQCVLKKCPEGAYWDTRKEHCVPCIGEGFHGSTTFPVMATTAAECAKCNDTEVPREIKDGLCVPACPAGMFLTLYDSSYGAVYDTTGGEMYAWCEYCEDDYPYPSSATGCAACNNTEYPREMVSGYCILQGSEFIPEEEINYACSSGYFMDEEGDCERCTYADRYIPFGEDETARAAECAKCNGTESPREMLNGYCVRSTCPSNYLRTTEGECRTCSATTGLALVNESDCSSCDGTSYPREMQNGLCVRKTCPSNYFKIGTGDCAYCYDSTPYIPLNEAQCRSCLSSKPRQMVDGYCILQRCVDERFMDIDGVCRLCSDATAYIPYDATECAKCAAVDQARVIASDGTCVYCPPGTALQTNANGGQECLPCPEGMLPNNGVCDKYFFDKNNNQHFCSERNQSLQTTAEECAKCDDSATPRFFGYNSYESHDVTYCILCPAGQFLRTDNMVCMDCSAGWDIPSSERACMACDNTTYPRHMGWNGARCVPGLGDCASGSFRDATGVCQPCSSETAYTPFGVDATAQTAQCAKCDDTANPRHMENGQCVLGADPDACPSGFFKDADGNCQGCDSKRPHAPFGEDTLVQVAECAKCDNTSYPREIVENKCVPVCSSDTFHRNGNYNYECFSCSNGEAVTPLNEEQCAKCSLTSTPRKIIGTRCALISCDAGYYHADTGHCRACSDATGYTPLTEAECALCDSSGSPRHMEGNLCVFGADPNACPTGQFRISDGSCISCTDGGDSYVPLDENECAKCANTSMPREMFEGFCIRQGGISCSSGQYFASNFTHTNARCQNCGDGSGFFTSATECAKCDARTYDESSHLCSPTCGDTQFIRGDTGGCAPCSWNVIVPSFSDTTCAKCNTTDTPREVRDGMCVRACGENGVLRNDGVCVGCTSNEIFVPYDETDCLKCREMGTGDFEGKCIPTCTSTQYRRSDGACVACNWWVAVEPASEAECAKCTTAGIPREMVDGNCVRACGENTFLTSAHSCAGCAQDGSIEPYSEATCNKCNSTANPRHMENGQCVLGAGYTPLCEQGKFMSSTGYCESCSSTSAFTPDSADECNACNYEGSQYPRQMLDNGVCALVNCPQGEFLFANGPCISCSHTSTWEVSDPSDCTKCNYTGSEYPRQMINNKCARVSCNSGEWLLNTGVCESCSSEITGGAVPFQVSECDRCSNRHMVGTACLLTTASCETGKFFEPNETGAWCRECSTYDAKNSTAEECAKCNSTTPRMFNAGSGKCCRECPYANQFRDENCNCHGCTDTNSYVPVTSEHCTAACPDSRHMENGQCVPGAAECASGSFKDSSGTCQECASGTAYTPYGSDASAQATECARCDGTGNPRVMLNGQCIKACATGKFMAQNGECIDCFAEGRWAPVGSTASDQATECGKCSSTATPRQMVSGNCVLTACPAGKFLQDNGECVTCNNDWDDKVPFGATTSDKTAECTKCNSSPYNGTIYPRRLLGNRCILASQTCQSGYFYNVFSDGHISCQACNNGQECMPSVASECSTCANTSTPRTYGYGMCCRTTVNEFRDSSGNARSCSDTESYVPLNVEQCTGCEIARHMEGDLCVLGPATVTCAAGTFKDEDNTCQSCSDNLGYVPYGANNAEQLTECSKCTGSNTRSMIEGLCVKSCSSSQFHKSDGSCVSCDVTTGEVPLDEDECTACVQRTEHVRMMYDGICYGTGCVANSFRGQNGLCVGCGQISSNAPASADQCLFCSAFLNTSNRCESCSKNDAVLATSENCALCDGTANPRQMSNGKCVPKCNATTQKVCSNSTNTWCCAKNADCGSGADENSKCIGKGKKCVYTLSGSTTNMVAVHGTPYECDADEYCFGKWNSDGSILSGSYKTTLYGMCLKMGETLDTPAEDAMNPWL